MAKFWKPKERSDEEANLMLDSMKKEILGSIYWEELFSTGRETDLPRSWFSKIGTEAAQDLYHRLWHRSPEYPITDAFSYTLSDENKFAIKDSYLNEDVLGNELDVNQTKIGQEAIAKIRKKYPNARASKNGKKLPFLLTDEDEGIVFTLQVFLINGEENLVWTTQALVATHSPNLAVSYCKKSANSDEIEEVQLDADFLEHNPTLVNFSYEIKVPIAFSSLFSFAEIMEMPDGESRFEAILPTIFVTINDEMLVSVDGEIQSASKFPITVNAGYRISSKDMKNLDIAVDLIPKFLTRISFYLREGFLLSNLQGPDSFHEILGSEFIFHLENRISRRTGGYGQWMPVLAALERTFWTLEQHDKAYAIESKEERESTLLNIIENGCGEELPAVVNTLIYSHYLPDEKYTESLDLGYRTIQLPENSQTVNTKNNMGIVWLLCEGLFDTSNVPIAKKYFLEVLNSEFEDCYQEAHFFLGLIALSESEKSTAKKHFRLATEFRGSYNQDAEEELGRL
jgi:hypothetical protein